MRKWMWRMGAAMALLMAGSVAVASGPGAVRKQAEAGMLVTGTVDIEPDGRVSGHLIDRAEEVPAGVLELIERAAPSWRFRPVLVDGAPVKARTRMSLRLGAKKQDGDQFVVDIRGARFGGPVPEQEAPRSVERDPPRYPLDAIKAGVSGTVYLVLRFGRDGRVEDAVAEQVNLRVVASESRMEVWRHRLAQASLRAARQWTFAPPISGEDAGDPSWSVRVPVDFRLGNQREARYGEWEAYIPGPRHGIPWHRSEEEGFAPDALATGGVYPLEHDGPRLLTGLNGV